MIVFQDGESLSISCKNKNIIKENIFNRVHEMIVSILRSGLLKSCARFFIERSEIRKKNRY